MYDASGRFALTTLYEAGTGDELLQAAFVYDGTPAVPVRTTVMRLSEGVVWVIE